MTAPTVSVVMLAYNAERFVREAIASILQQTYTDFELLIIDDGSTDGTSAILQEYARRDVRIHIHTQPDNLGIASGRNLGLKLAQGKYLAVMDADDISLPERLAKQVAYLESHPETGVLGASAIVIDETSQRHEPMDFPASHRLIHWSLCFYDPIVNPVVMFRTELAYAAGGYRPEYPPTEDYDLWARLSTYTRLENLPERLLLLRKHSQNITVTKRRQNLEMSAAVSRHMFKNLLGVDIPVTPIELAWEPHTIPAHEIKVLSCAIKTLLKHFLSQPGLTAPEKGFIRRESALQLIRLLRNTTSPTVVVRLLFYALRIDPLSLFTAMRYNFKKRTNHKTVS